MIAHAFLLWGAGLWFVCPNAVALQNWGPGLLPDVLAQQAAPNALTAVRRWEITDLVEAREITGLAVSTRADRVAFIVKQGFRDLGQTRYALYVANPRRPGSARKALESAYLADLSRHPNTELWTVRAELGAGVQLYDVDDLGTAVPIVVNPDLVEWGGEVTGLEPPHNVGVLQYQWTPDGAALWYARVTKCSLSEFIARHTGGIVYDSGTMTADAFRYGNSLVKATELRYAKPGHFVDRLLVSYPDTGIPPFDNTTRDMVWWSLDSKSIEYLRWELLASGNWGVNILSVGVDSGDVHRIASDGLVAKLQIDNMYTSATVNGKDRIAVVKKGTKNRLVGLTRNGDLATDYGDVKFNSVERTVARRRHAIIVLVNYGDHVGLASIGTHTVRELSSGSQYLSHCDFAPSSEIGSCARESWNTAPEVISVSATSGRSSTIVRVDTRYDAIMPLVTRHQYFRNKYGQINDGYVMLPRHYAPGRKFPTIVVTHYHDARNRFLYQGFQWDYPIQVFAERDYLVLAVNEPTDIPRNEGVGTNGNGPQDAQMNQALAGVASMEAALQALVDDGIADPARTGIAGYSRGGELVSYVMSQSSMFKAASLGNSSFSAVSYWMAGSSRGRRMANMLFGGSLFGGNAEVWANYRSFAPAFRAAHVTGPLLEQFSAREASGALELHMALQDVGVPAELVYFPGEGHLFWSPQHRASAMAQNLDWFDYWLRGLADSTASAEQYMRWDEMATKWKRTLARRRLSATSEYSERQR